MSQTVTNHFDEKRRYERISKSFTMEYRVFTPGDFSLSAPLNPGQLCDIGAGGLRFTTNLPIEKNDQLIIALEFTGWRVDDDEWIATGIETDSGSLRLFGRVMWVANNEVDAGMLEAGVCFIGRIH